MQLVRLSLPNLDVFANWSTEDMKNIEIEGSEFTFSEFGNINNFRYLSILNQFNFTHRREHEDYEYYPDHGDGEDLDPDLPKIKISFHESLRENISIRKNFYQLLPRWFEYRIEDEYEDSVDSDSDSDASDDGYDYECEYDYDQHKIHRFVRTLLVGRKILIERHQCLRSATITSRIGQIHVKVRFDVDGKEIEQFLFLQYKLPRSCIHLFRVNEIPTEGVLIDDPVLEPKWCFL
jgi:hypothetical protein